ncbi:LmeA family phospholipid-binding protein [Williamsia sp. SKLECPSW1]
MVGSSRSRPRLRRVLWAVIVVVVVAVLGALGTDTAIAINAERSLARAFVHPTDGNRGLPFEPEVTISGFPAYRSVADGRYSSIGITARAVPVYAAGTCTMKDPCHADLRTRLSDVRVAMASISHPFPYGAATMRVGSATASTTLDSVAMGRLLRIDDLTVNTPAPEGEAGGGGPQDGLLSRTSGVLLTGSVSPGPGRPKEKVSVTVDLSVVDGALRLSATGFYDGPEEHSDTTVAVADRRAVLEQFSATIPDLPMAWGATATSARSSGSDIMVEGTPHSQTWDPGFFLTAQNQEVYMMYTCHSDGGFHRPPC